MPLRDDGTRFERVTREQRERYIKEARAAEQNADCASLINNLPTMRLILIWPRVLVFVPEEPVEYPAEIQRMARRIWLGIEVDMDEVSTFARIPFAKAREHLKEAQMNLWIYPDGQVHEFARKLSISTMARLARDRKIDQANSTSPVNN